MADNGMYCYKEGWTWGDQCPEGWMLSDDGMYCSVYWDGGVEIVEEVCSYNQIKLDDGTCEMCPPYMAPDLNGWYCESPMCDYRDIITVDGACQHCEDYFAPDFEMKECVSPICDEFSIITADGLC
jgi:hypothetical protein